MADNIPLTCESVQKISIELLDAVFYPHDLKPAKNGLLKITGTKWHYSYRSLWLFAFFRRRKAVVNWQFDIELVVDCQPNYHKYADKVNAHECAGVFLRSENILEIETHSGLTIKIAVEHLSGQLVIDDPIPNSSVSGTGASPVFSGS